MGELADETEHYEVSAFAFPPAGNSDYAMVLVLASGRVERWAGELRVQDASHVGIGLTVSDEDQSGPCHDSVPARTSSAIRRTASVISIRDP